MNDAASTLLSSRRCKNTRDFADDHTARRGKLVDHIRMVYEYIYNEKVIHALTKKGYTIATTSETNTRDEKAVENGSLNFFSMLPV